MCVLEGVGHPVVAVTLVDVQVLSAHRHADHTPGEPGRQASNTQSYSSQAFPRQALFYRSKTIADVENENRVGRGAAKHLTKRFSFAKKKIGGKSASRRDHERNEAVN